MTRIQTLKWSRTAQRCGECVVILAARDVVRDESEASACRLIAADVPTTSVRLNGTIHDLLVLDPPPWHRRDHRGRAGQPRHSRRRSPRSFS